MPVKSRPSAAAMPPAPIFVVQKHRAQRAGLHWDFRLEHGGVLWSWAVRKGPSLDPADRRMAIHVEDHPIEYADFQGRIPDGQYGAGEVAIWDRGTWQPLEDPEEGMRRGSLRFVLSGQRLHGRFTLARLGGKDRRQDAWYLIKGHDAAAREGADVAALEQTVTELPARAKPAAARTPPAPGAVRGAMPQAQAPQLCAVAEQPPAGDGWLCEIKFDGYRLLAAVADGRVRLLTRNGHDWSARLPAVARALARLPVQTAMLDGELVSLRADGVSSFPGLQAALKAGRDDRLVFYAFDLLHLDGWDLRPCALADRKRVLAGLAGWGGLLRYSDHHDGDTVAMRRNACRMHLEGIVCKQADAPYHAGRGRAWVKLKCSGREEFIVLGWTPPARSRVGIGALHVGYHDPEGGLHYAGGVGTGFSDDDLRGWRARLDAMALPAPPPGLSVSDEPIEPAIRWVQPDLVIEVQFTDWSGAGRLRHAVCLGLREDKVAADVVRPLADPAAPRHALPPRRGRATVVAAGPRPPPRPATGGIVVARAPQRAAVTVAGVEITHPDRALWPGITKRDLAQYWQAVAEAALPGIAQRPLSVLRCPDGIDGREQFFQKHGHGVMPAAVREGMAAKQPYLAIDDVAGLVALAQMSAIELHAWGAAEADPTHPDRLVFDLDPGEGVAWAAVVRAARDVRDRLERLGLASFCRTTGGKGLHVVVPVRPAAEWAEAKRFCKAFAESLAQEQPERFLAHLKLADRHGRILLDWLRNGLGATAVASFSPRARPGATVATPLAWREVTETLDPSAHTLRSVPARLARLKADPWDGFARAGQRVPDLPVPRPAAAACGETPAAAGKPSAIVVATRPKPRRRPQ